MSDELIVQENKITEIIARVELDTMISTANAYPRDEIKSIEKAIKMATIDEETAQGCFYALPRKDKDGNKITIEGDSIRLAEIIRCSWKHMHTQTKVVVVSEKYIETEAVAWDLENNNKHISNDRISIWFGEKNGKGGYRANNDMQIMLAKASQAKALRNAIFQVVPKSLVKVVGNAARKYSIGDSKNLSSKLTTVVNKLVKMGLNKEQMFEYFDHSKIDDFTAEDLQSLIGIGTALKDGMIKPEEVFSIEKNTNESASDKLNELIAVKKSPKIESYINSNTGEVLNGNDLPY